MTEIHEHHQFIASMLARDLAWVSEVTSRASSEPLNGVQIEAAFFAGAGAELNAREAGLPLDVPAVAELRADGPAETLEWAWWDGVQLHRVGRSAGPRPRIAASKRLLNPEALAVPLFPDRFRARIITSDARFVNFFEGWDWDLEVMAHALGGVSRFTGHTLGEPYSVAQHSVYVSEAVQAAGGSLEEQRAGLLHDGVEAVLGDVSAPLKRLLPGYQRLEERLGRQLADTHGLPYPWPSRVHEADMRMLQTERRDLLPYNPEPWSPYVERFEAYPDLTLRPWRAADARDAFLARARVLGLWAPDPAAPKA